jgi:hypothetical protein
MLVTPPANLLFRWETKHFGVLKCQKFEIREKMQYGLFVVASIYYNLGSAANDILPDMSRPCTYWLITVVAPNCDQGAFSAAEQEPPEVTCSRPTVHPGQAHQSNLYLPKVPYLCQGSLLSSKSLFSVPPPQSVYRRVWSRSPKSRPPPKERLQFPSPFRNPTPRSFCL